MVRQSAAARALAGLDWPAAIGWIERRWAWTGDAVALDGLLTAAARGRVAPSLQRAHTLRSMLDLVESQAAEVRVLAAARAAALASSTVDETERALVTARDALDVRAFRMALGLRAIAPVLLQGRGEGASVRPLGPFLFRDFDEVSDYGKWLRLAIAEGTALRGDGVAAAARSVLQSGTEFGSLRRQALRTLVGLPPSRATAGIVLRRPLDLFLSRPGGVTPDVGGTGLELGLVATLHGVRADFGGRQIPAELLADNAALVELLVWAALRAESSEGEALERGVRMEPPPAWVLQCVRAAVAQTTRALEARSPNVRALRGSAFMEAARELRGVRGQRSSSAAPRGSAALQFANPIDGLVRWVAPGLPLDERAELASLEVRVGGQSTARRRATLASAKASLVAKRDDPVAVERAWLDLAALAGDETVGADARGVLRESLIESLRKRSEGPAGRSAILLFAAEQAIWSMEASRLDQASEEFQSALQGAAARAEHPVSQRFYQVEWPPRRQVPARDLERLEPAPPPSLGVSGG